MKIRGAWLLFHRYGGLLLAVPLIIVALTGTIIAFTLEVNRLITPERYVKPRTDAPALELESLAKRIEAAVIPGETVLFIGVREDQVVARVQPRADSAVGFEETERGKAALQPYALYFDPWTGERIAKQVSRAGEPVRDNRFMRLMHSLHDDLAMGIAGRVTLGIIALLWTIDCFVSWYLTLPISKGEFWRRWKPAWKVKKGASAYRLNFDLHRAIGLWLWPILLVFAWSSVSLNLPAVYDPVTRSLFEYKSSRELRAEFMAEQEMFMQKFKADPGEPAPGLTEIVATAGRLAAQESVEGGLVGAPDVSIIGLNRRQGTRLINATVRSRSPQCREAFTGRCVGALSFDGRSGELVEWRVIGLNELKDEATGNFITRWIRTLHFGQSLGIAYQIFVSVLGLIVTLVSATGVYIWWKKRSAKIWSNRRKARGKMAVDGAA